MYHGNSKDKIDCPEKVNQIDKRGLIYSVLLEPHMTLNNSIELAQKRAQQKSQKGGKPIKNYISDNDLVGFNSNMVCWNSKDNQNENDNDELLQIIENIPEIDMSQFPAEDFLIQNIPDFPLLQQQYH